MKNLFFSALLVLTFGCNSAKTKKDAMSSTTLQDGSFTVVSVLGTDVTAEKLTLAFTEGGKTISGFSGCNTYFGAINTKESASLFTGIGATKKFCASTMKTEKIFLETLGKVATVKMNETTIGLNNENGDVIIVLNN